MYLGVKASEINERCNQNSENLVKLQQLDVWLFLGNTRFLTQGRSQKCLCQAAAKALRRKKVNGPKNWPRFSFHMEGDLISFSPFIASYFGIEWTQLASGQKIHLSVFIIFLLKAALNDLKYGWKLPFKVSFINFQWLWCNI